MSQLFSPLSIRGLTMRNRAWVSPMCQYSALDGVVGAWHRAHLGSFATGGVGLIMAEATAVTPEGRISVNCPGIWNHEQVEAWRPIVEFVHEHGAMIGLQLAHAGRKASTMAPWADHQIASVAEGGWEALAPSAIAFEGYPTPLAMDEHAITRVVEAFAEGATRALEAGFDLVELHAAHGYLIHQFLSPLSNQRTDEYGGSFENRVRLLVRVVDAVRGVLDEATPVFVRISATDYVEGGWDLAQSERLAPILAEHGVDLIDVSSGGNVAHAVIPFGPGYQVHFAEAVKHAGSARTSAVGLITDAHQAEAVVTEGRADAVMLARAMLRNPRWALNAAESLGAVIEWPRQFDRARTLRT